MLLPCLGAPASQSEAQVSQATTWVCLSRMELTHVRCSGPDIHAAPRAQCAQLMVINIGRVTVRVYRMNLELWGPSRLLSRRKQSSK